MASKKTKQIIIIIGILICFLCLYISYLRSEEFSDNNSDKKVFNFYNKHSLYGDNILNLKFLYNIREYLKNNNIIINYYYNPDIIKNVDELQRYIDTSTVNLLSFDKIPKDAIFIQNNLEMSESIESIKSKNVPIFYNLWMGNNINNVSHSNFDTYHNLYYKNILHILGIQDTSIDTSLYQKEDYLLDLYEKLDPKYKDVYILIINSRPVSLHRIYNEEKMDALCISLASKYNVVTTKCVNDTIKCTMRDNLKIQDIGAISTHAKYIIAIHTGPLNGCWNTITKKHVKKWFIIHVDEKIEHKEINNMVITNFDNLNKIDLQMNI